MSPLFLLTEGLQTALASSGAGVRTQPKRKQVSSPLVFHSPQLLLLIQTPGSLSAVKGASYVPLRQSTVNMYWNWNPVIVSFFPFEFSGGR